MNKGDKVLINIKMRSYNTWQCPFCSAKGKTNWNKESYWQLTDHLKANHLTEAFDHIMTLNGANIKLSVIDRSWKVFNGCVIFHQGESNE